MFRMKPNRKDRAVALNLYRSCMRTIKQLQPSHQKLWYDYTRLKFAEHEGKSPAEVKKVISAAFEELEWVKSVVARRDA